MELRATLRSVWVISVSLIVLLFLASCSSLGATETLDLAEELRSRGQFVYPTEYEALKDIETASLADELQERGLHVYGDASEIVEDIEDAGFYVYENPSEALEDIDPYEALDYIGEGEIADWAYDWGLCDEYY